MVGFEKALGAVKVIKESNSIQASELAQLSYFSSFDVILLSTLMTRQSLSWISDI